MNKLVPITSPALPALVAMAGERASMRFLEFFAAQIRNPHTRRAYARAADEFLAWCAGVGVSVIGAAQPVHVATWIEAGSRELAAPSAKQRVAAIRQLFHWLVTRQVVPVNPAASLRGPGHAVTSGQTPVLNSEARAARQHRHVDRRRPARSRPDRAHGLFLRPDWRGARDDGRGCLHAEPPAVGAVARKGAASGTRSRATTTSRNTLPPISRAPACAAIPRAAIRHHRPWGPVSSRARSSRKQSVYAIIARRAGAAGTATKLGNHSFRATRTTACLKNAGTLDKAAAVANHASTRATQLYDCRRDELNLDEVERIAI